MKEPTADLAGIDLASPEAAADPYRAMTPLREADDGVHWNEPFGGWVIARYDDVRDALHDWERLSSDRISPYYEARLEGPKRDLYLPTYEILRRWMVFVDPPGHKRLRTLVDHAFKPRTLDAQEPRIAALVDELLDPLAGSVDWVSSFAYLLPVLVISDFLGVPAADRHLIKGWSDTILQLIFGDYTVPDRHERAREAFVAFGDYLRGHVADRRKRPGDDLISELVRAREDDDALTEDEVVATCVLLLFGGHETTTNLLANGLLALLRHPEQMARYRSEGDALGKWPVEELLRYDGPSKAAPRVVRVDHDRGGRRLRAGEKVLILQCAANRDPRQFDAPDRLDLGRRPNPHLTFGYGIHYCIGAPLARVEGRLAFPRLFERFREVELDQEAPPPAFSPTILSRSLRRLPVRLTPR